MEISTIFGLPAHPLFVHLPVVGIPLMALAVIAYIVLPARPNWLFWTAGALSVVVPLATVLTASSGEQLQSMLPAEDQHSSLVSRHVELGEQTEYIVIAFAALALAYLALDWWRRNRVTEPHQMQPRFAGRANTLGRLIVVIGVAAILAGSVATVWDVRTGHAGAQSSWEDVAAESGS